MSTPWTATLEINDLKNPTSTNPATKIGSETAWIKANDIITFKLPSLSDQERAFPNAKNIPDKATSLFNFKNEATAAVISGVTVTKLDAATVQTMRNNGVNVQDAANQMVAGYLTFALGFNKDYSEMTLTMPPVLVGFEARFSIRLKMLCDDLYPGSKADNHINVDPSSVGGGDTLNLVLI